MHSNHALILSLVRRWPEALAASERALALQPDSIQGRSVKAEALLGLGRRAEAAELFRALLATGDFDRHMTAAYLAGRLALAGDREKATSLLAAVQANSAKADTDVALALFAMDKFDEAMLYLKKNHLKLRAYDLLDGTVFDGIRSTPRFTQLVEASGEPEVYRQKWAQISSFAKLSGKP
jgi:tetratricopeptide (TPR) repeat protein